MKFPKENKFPLKLVEFEPRFLNKEILVELANLWHLSKVHSNSRYERMIYTSKYFAVAHPNLSPTAIYKDLEAWLAWNN